jgi:hypothetical protein
LERNGVRPWKDHAVVRGGGEVGGLRRKRGDAEGICRGRWARRIMEDWRMAGKKKAGDGVGL